MSSGVRARRKYRIRLGSYRIGQCPGSRQGQPLSRGRGPRDDGYHELTTVFHAVSLLDEVTVTHRRRAVVGGRRARARTRCPTDERNLAWQAAELLAEHVGRAPDVAISIEKSIPVAGGMAGGSADAAAVLVAMNSLWELGVPRRDLHALAAQLGSDVPFALHGGTALGTGRGEELATVLARNTFHWVLAFADGRLVHPRGLRRDRPVCGTAEDRNLPPRLDDPEPVLAALASGDPARAGPAARQRPAAGGAEPGPGAAPHAACRASRPARWPAIVSGSGPTCAFLCTSAAAAVDVGTRAGRRRGVPHRAGGQRAGARRPGGAEPLRFCLKPGVCRRAVWIAAVTLRTGVTHASIIASVWQLLKSCLR